jgi:protein transport protein SEC24
MKPGADVYIQCAMVYTNVRMQRRIRVHTLALPVSAEIGVVFRHLDLDTVTNVMLRNGAFG